MTDQAVHAHPLQELAVQFHNPEKDLLSRLRGILLLCLNLAVKAAQI